MHGNATLYFHPILVLTLVSRHFLIYILILINLLEEHIHIEYEKHIQQKADTTYLTTLAPEAQRLLLKGASTERWKKPVDQGVCWETVS